MNIDIPATILLLGAPILVVIAIVLLVVKFRRKGKD